MRCVVGFVVAVDIVVVVDIGLHCQGHHQG
jgi:hypothetical protein